MKDEILILKTDLDNIFKYYFIDWLCRNGYNKTGCKFSISFNGSKGYLDNISIDCEGNFSESGIIRRNDFFTSKNQVRKRIVNVYHSDEKGVRISFGNDKPQRTSY